MAIKRCPFCGHEEDDGKQYRNAIYIKDQRVAIFLPNSISIEQLVKIVKGTPNGYLMQEVLDKEGNIISAQRRCESAFTEANGIYSRRAD